MGYVHDVDLVTVLGPHGVLRSSTWYAAPIRDGDGLWSFVKDFAAETFYMTVPVVLPASWLTKRGVKLAGVELFYELKATNATAVDGWFEQLLLPVDGAAFEAATLPAVTLAGKDLEDIGNHVAGVFLDADLWLSPICLYQAVFEVTVPAPTSVYCKGARLSFTLQE